MGDSGIRLFSKKLECGHKLLRKPRPLNLVVGARQGQLDEILTWIGQDKLQFSFVCSGRDSYTYDDDKIHNRDDSQSEVKRTEIGGNGGWLGRRLVKKMWGRHNFEYQDMNLVTLQHVISAAFVECVVCHIGYCSLSSQECPCSTMSHTMS